MIRITADHTSCGKYSSVSLSLSILKKPTKVKMFRRIFRRGDKKKDDKKNDSNDPWDRIRKIMGTAGREKTCVVTNLDYMKTSKQAYVFFSHCVGMNSPYTSLLPSHQLCGGCQKRNLREDDVCE